MKIVIIGGSGLIGTKLASKLRQLGHEVNAASPSSGVNAVTGEGLDKALEGAEVVVDVANSPSFEDQGSLEVFRDVKSQSSCSGSEGRRPSSCCVVRRRH